MIIIAGDAAEDEKNEKVLIKKGRDGFLLNSSEVLSWSTSSES